jgi:sugar lactone lactonase YvrE
MQLFFRRLSSFFVLIALAGVANAQTRIISPAAGTGAAGFSGDGGQATSAQLHAPVDVAVDVNGDFFIADRNNNRIRKVDTGTGVIRTVAGSGAAGWFFSGGPALFASLDHPAGVVVDNAGNFYIADLLENDFSRIHRVSASNNVISRIELPVIIRGAVAIALDSDNNLYIAEQAGNRIRKFGLSSGSFTTVAGTGVPGFSGDGGAATAAQINGPVHLAIDSEDNLYFSDSLNHRIRKVSAATGIISTIAGSGPAGGAGAFSGDGGIATSARLNNPRGVAIDSVGNIFIADTLNKRIRRISASTGVIATIVSGEATEDCAVARSSMTSPESLAVNAPGNVLYITDDRGNRIWQVTLNPNNLPPSLEVIDPGRGTAGSTVTVQLTGDGFLGESAVSPESGCRINGTTVFVSGDGVIVSNVNVTSDTALSATFTLAPGAPEGAREVTVTTDSGTSPPVQFIVDPPPIPLPTLTSLAPASGARESVVVVTMTGTNFIVRGPTTVSIDGEGVSISDVRLYSPTTLTAVFTIAADAPLGPRNVAVVTGGGSSNTGAFTVAPQGPALTYALPEMLNPTENAPIQVGLANVLPDPVTAQLRLTFDPNASHGRDDPNVMFINSQSSTRTVSVVFPANTQTAELSLPSGVLQAGTVAGSIELTMTEVQVGGMAAIPTGSEFDVQVPRLVPIITSVRILNRSAGGFDVEVTGYSTSREISGAIFSFGAASGAQLLTVHLEPDVRSTFNGYYESDVSTVAGSAFVYLQPFIVERGDVNAVASVTVALTNAQGTSEPKTAQ